MTTQFSGITVILAFVALATVPARAADVDGIAFHGSVSMTESSSNDYNFYGDTADWRFDNNVREVTLNGAYRFADGVRISAQVYSYDLDNYSEIVLDFANIDYQFKPWFGVRVGRNKSETGLYGDAQDLDQVRTFANLPLSFYPKNIRPLSYSDGLNLYGSVDLGTGGNLDYSGFAGDLSSVPSDAPIALMANGLTTADTIKLPLVYGLYTMWNSPVEGLRIGYTFQAVPRIEVSEQLSTKEEATMPGLKYSSTPILIDEGYGAGTWDSAFAGQPAQTTDFLYSHILSAEYTWKDWVFAAEAKASPSHSTSTIPALGVKDSYAATREEDAYLMATYQATKKIGLGLYYSYQTSNALDHTTASDLLVTRDAAGVVSYAIESWWLVKAEFHRIDGLGLVNSAGDSNPNAPAAGSKWDYVVFKTTFSF